MGLVSSSIGLDWMLGRYIWRLPWNRLEISCSIHSKWGLSTTTHVKQETLPLLLVKCCMVPVISSYGVDELSPITWTILTCKSLRSLLYMQASWLLDMNSWKTFHVNKLNCSRSVPFRKVPIPVWVLVHCVTERNKTKFISFIYVLHVSYIIRQLMFTRLYIYIYIRYII